MPAYWFPSKHPCEHPRCGKQADGQVRNSANAPVGWFCEPHGHRVVEEMNTGSAPWDKGPVTPEWADRLLRGDRAW